MPKRKERDGSAQSAVKTHSIGFNVLMNMVLTSSKFIFPLITVPYVSRVLSTYGTGAVAFAQSVANYFSLAAVLGMTNYGITTCAKVRDDPAELSATVRELMTILAVSTTLSLVCYVGACLWVPRLQENRGLFLLFGSAVLLTAMGVEWLYQALEQYAYITVRSIVFKFLGLLLMFALVRTRDDYFLYGVCVIVSGYLSNVLNMVCMRRFVAAAPSRRLDPRRHLRPMLWYSIAAVSSGMYTQVDIVLLGFMGTTGMVGLYQLVSKVRTLAITVMNSVGNVLLPRLSYYASQDRGSDVARLIGKNASFVVVASTAWVCFCGLCSRQVIGILGGADFADAAVPLVLASPSVAFSALNIALAGYLMANGREREWSVINVIGLCLAAAYDALLIPALGVRGAAVGVTLTELSVLVMRSSRCRELVAGVVRDVEIHKVLLAAAAGVAAGFSAGRFTAGASDVVSLVVVTAAFGACYLAALLAVRDGFVIEMCGRLAGRLRGSSR